MGFAWLLGQIPLVKGMLDPSYTVGLLTLAVTVALVTGVLGALYPAWRATKMQPIEALRYE
jgi:putative ABC transport system permease protein